MADYEENQNGEKGSNPEEDDRKMFIGGVGWDTTVDDLKDYFSRYGVVSHCTLKSESATGQNRGFGFVIFQDKTSIDKVLQDKHHMIRGRVVDPKRALARGGKEAERKIFVGGLDPDMTEEEVKTFFTRYGKVEYIDMPFDRVKNIRRGFCFITFDSNDAVDRAVSVPRQKIGTRDCDVKRGMTREELGSGNSGRASRGGGRNFNSRNRGGRGRGGNSAGGSGGGGGRYGGAPQGWQQSGPVGGGASQGGYNMSSSYYGGPSGDYGMGGGYGGSGYGYNSYSAPPQQQTYGSGYGYQDYYGANQAGSWGNYGQMAAYGNAAYGGGGQQSNYGKAKRGQASGSSNGYHPYQR